MQRRSRLSCRTGSIRRPVNKHRPPWAIYIRRTLKVLVRLMLLLHLYHEPERRVLVLEILGRPRKFPAAPWPNRTPRPCITLGFERWTRAVGLTWA